MMLRHIPPAEMIPPTAAPDRTIGYMPQNTGNAAAAAQKRDAIERWIRPARRMTVTRATIVA